MEKSQKTGASYTDLLPTDPHSATICGQTSCGKTVFVLDLLETKCFGQFEHIVILCRTLKYNQSYKEKDWLHTDPGVYLVDRGRHSTIIYVLFIVCSPESRLYNR